MKFGEKEILDWLEYEQRAHSSGSEGLTSLCVIQVARMHNFIIYMYYLLDSDQRVKFLKNWELLPESNSIIMLILKVKSAGY